MSKDATTIWALTASAIALVLAGVVVGQSINSNQAATALANQQPPSATEPDAVPIVERYLAPAWLHSAPKEWRTPFNGMRDSYALLLDHERRELLVEQCTFNGFFDVRKNVPVEREPLTCTRVLTSYLLEFNPDGVLVKRKDGSELQVYTQFTSKESAQSLSMQFEQHAFKLIPGQPNDLNIELSSTDEALKQKQLLAEYNAQKIQQERAHLLASSEDGVPRFALPSTNTETEEERNAKRTASE